MEDIYREVIIDHYRNPHNRGVVKSPDFQAKEENVFCGDWVEVSGELQNKRIRDIKFRGAGCVISQASASILTDYMKNKSLDTIQKMSTKDLIKILGIDLSPTRLKCAELSLICLKKALNILK